MIEYDYKTYELNNYFVLLSRGNVDPGVMREVKLVLDFLFDKEVGLKVRPFLHVAVIDAQTVRLDDSDPEGASGVYLEGLGSICIAGRKPDDMDESQFLFDTRITVLHEALHYCQDINRAIPVGMEQNELEIEQVSMSMAFYIEKTRPVLGEGPYIIERKDNG
jgi:hypothetical protein